MHSCLVDSAVSSQQESRVLLERGGLSVWILQFLHFFPPFMHGFPPRVSPTIQRHAGQVNLRP